MHRQITEKPSLCLEDTAFADIEIDQEARFISWSAAARKLFGYTAREALGRDLNLIIPEEYIKLNKYRMRLMAEAGPGKITGRRIEIIARKKSGAEMIVACKPVMYRCGKNLCFKISMRDITAEAIYGLTGATPAGTGGGFLRLLQKIVAAAGAMTEAQSAAYLTAPDQCVTMVAGWRMPPDIMPPPWPLQGSLAGRVLTGNATMPVTLDQHGLARFARTDPLPRAVGAASFAGCAVRHADAAGVLCVFFTSPAPPATGLIDRLAGLAAMLQDALPLAEEFQLSQYRQHLLRDYVRRLSSGMFDIVEQEKKQLARTLHDELGAMAVAMDAHLTLAEDEITGRTPEAAMHELACVRSTLEQSVCSLKQVAANLRPAELDIADTERFFREYFADLEKKTGLIIFFNCTIDMPRLPEPVTVALYRLIQESMNNIIKHARAGHASVLLQADRDAVRLHIVDDGRGFDATAAHKNAQSLHLGLQGMRERVAALRGTFSLTSNAGDGTEIKIHIPLQEAPTHDDTGNSGRRSHGGARGARAFF